MSDSGGGAKAHVVSPGSGRPATPNSRGLSAASGLLSISGLRVDDLTPWVAEDVRKAQQCELDDMLEYILSRVLEIPNNSIDLKNHTLLEECMKQVLPICNGEAQRGDIKGFQLGDIKRALEQYTMCTREDALYEPFVLASNTALAYLKQLRIHGMREGENEAVQMFFQRNDPNVIVQKHDGHESRRKPDIVVLSFANHNFAGDRVTWGNHVSGLSQNKTDVKSWGEVFGVFEFKRSKSKMRSPPEKYSVLEYEAPKPKFLKVGKDRNELEGTEPREAPATKPVMPAEQIPVRKSNRATTQIASSNRAPETNSGSHASKRSGTEVPGAHVTFQTALYAAEMLPANIGAKHSLNYIVINDNIWIWYYDHQGLISVAGFNFVQDLPRFLVLLYALQRFNLGDWGRNTAFKARLKEDGVESYTVAVGKHTLELVYGKKPRYGLKGRGTAVLDVTCKTLEAENPVGGMVAKLYWPEEARVPEKDILEYIKLVEEKCDEIQGHTPVLLLSKRFPESTATSAIRQALDLENPEKGSRVFVLLVFKKLFPITKLESDELVDAWRQCVLCHYALWDKGVHHRDVSDSNLMYYRDGDKVIGVLNDYDLSSLKHRDNPLGNERTGTMPFMAIDLLKDDGQDGKVEHRYRHDMESLIYVFIWISLQYKNGEPLKAGPLDAWTKTDARGCIDKKSGFLTLREVPEDVDNYDLVMDLVIFLAQRLNTHNHRKATEKAARRRLADARSSDAVKAAAQNTLNTLGDLREEEDEEVYKAFLSQIPSVN